MIQRPDFIFAGVIDLANVFYRLHLIEAYGTGISKIIGAYADVAEKPVIETTRNTFKIVLPNINVLCEKTDTPESEVKDEKNPEMDEEDTQKLSDEEEKVLEYAENCEDFTKNDEECLQTFLNMQSQLFDEPVAETLEEAEAFLEDCMAVVVDSIKDVRDYLDESGADISGMSDEELEEASEVFALPNGQYLIVEG